MKHRLISPAKCWSMFLTVRCGCCILLCRSITEEIYQALPGSAETIMTQEWPDAAKLPTWPEESADFEQLMDYIKAVRASPQ